jgi:transposase InsO family protein
MKKDYSIFELSNCLKMSRQYVDKRAVSESWPYESRSKRLGGNVYPFETLPVDVQKTIMAGELKIDQAACPPISADNSDPDQLQADIEVFTSAPEAAHKKAEARALILDAWANFNGGDLSLKKKEAFVLLYQNRLLTDIKKWVYEVQPKLSRASLDNYRAAFTAKGIVGLLSRAEACGRKTEITPDLNMVLMSAIGEDPHVRGSVLVEKAKQLLGEKVPDRATIYRWHQKWKESNDELYCHMNNPADWKNRYKVAHGSLSDEAEYAGQVWQMDSTPADVETTEPGEKKGRRCSITAALEIYSRRPVVVVANTSTGDTVAAAARKGILAWGVPEKVRMDNGKDYQSKHVQSVIFALNVIAPKLEAFKSEAKGNIERFFGTMARNLEERLPAFTGHCVKERAAIREQEHWARRLMKKSAGPNKPVVKIPLSQAELAEAINTWITEVYENRVHKGFDKDKDTSKRGLTPLQAFERSQKKAPKIMNERALDILLMRKKEVTVHKKGILINRAQYINDELAFIVGQKVDVRINPEDAGTIYVYYQKKFLCAAEDRTLLGMPTADYFKAQARQKKRVQQLAKGLKEVAESIHQPYTLELENMKLSSVDQKAEEATGGIVQFEAIAAFTSEEYEAAVDTVAAIDGVERPEAKVIEYVPDIIWPKHEPEPERDKWAQIPDEIINDIQSTILIYEWYLEKEKEIGLTDEDRKNRDELIEQNYDFLDMLFHFKKSNNN